MTLPNVKWDAAGAQVILKEDFKEIEAAIMRVVTNVVSSPTPTPTVGSSGASVQYNINSLAVDAAFGVPTGTPIDGQILVIRILDAGVGKNLTWASGAGGYIARGATPPATSGTGKYQYVHFGFNANATRWDCVQVITEA
jgi:hypothetical protein